MRYVVLTDIHANLEALDACLADAAARGYDRTLVLGDLVGYGPDPNAVVDRVRALGPAAIVRGNHDKVACGIEQADSFNAVARSAAIWTLETLTPEHREWLAALQPGPCIVDDLIEICHGSPFDEDAYIFDELDALRALRVATRPLCLFGHTHFPATFELFDGTFESIDSPVTSEAEVMLKPGTTYLINPGSVGQPRDGDARAAYAIVNATKRSVELLRVKYSVGDTQAKVIRAGLPEVLAHRLAAGR
jgi:diadenosine tetraphosphatase ApaH/serine/threonine PP2A family protein phosphatase